MKNRTEFIRVEKVGNFTTVHNQFVKRSDISWKAKGILLYILHLPDNWNINLNEVMRHATEGERAFRSGWKELEEAGYVSRVAVRKGNRIDHWETVVREFIDPKRSSELCGFVHVQNEDVQNEDVQNSKLLNTNNTKDVYISNTNNIKSPPSGERDRALRAEEKSEPIPYKEIVDYLNEKACKNYRHTTKKTQELIRARVNEGFELDDFKRVIDTKTTEWKGDKEMDKFLRPYTLFGTKFEGYLQEEPIKISSQSVKDYYKEMERKEYKLDEEGYIF